RRAVAAAGRGGHVRAVRRRWTPHVGARPGTARRRRAHGDARGTRARAGIAPAPRECRAGRERHATRRRAGLTTAMPMGSKSTRLARSDLPSSAPRTGERARMSRPDSIRIANAGGYWGDDLSQFRRQVELGPVDYVTLDFLAEITMSIMQKQRARDPEAGYARDFVAQVEESLPLLLDRDVRVISNAGGVNPLACRAALLAMAQTHGRSIEVTAVAGDDLMQRLGELHAAGVTLDHMEDRSPFAAI